MNTSAKNEKYNYRETNMLWKMPKAFFIPAILGTFFHCGASDSVRDPQLKLQVLKNGNAVHVRSYFSAEQDVLIAVGKGPNGQINFSNTRLISSSIPMNDSALVSGFVLHRCGDDSAPWNLNGTYIGANHGCAAGREIVTPKHGLTVADIGSEWLDDAAEKFYIIKVPNPDTVWILSENKSGDEIWKFNGIIKGQMLKSGDGSKTLDAKDNKMVQLIPACRINKQKYLVNGKTPLEDGRVTHCDWLDIEEDYDIMAPDSLLTAIRNNPGKEMNFSDASLDSIVNNRIVYRFLPMGACTVDHNSTARRNFKLGYMGFVQSAPLETGSLSTHEYYVPKTLPFELKGRKYDFAHFEDFSQKLPGELLFGPKYKNTSDSKNPPDRFIQFLGEKKSGAPERKIGYVIGYSLIEGITRPETRAANCEAFLYLYVSNKTYPHAIDGGKVEAGKEFHCLAYRQYFDASAYKNATSVYWHKESDSYLLYVDYHKSVENDMIKLPDYLSGKKISIVEKTPSVKLLTDTIVPSKGLSLSVDGAYGYAVLKLD